MDDIHAATEAVAADVAAVFAVEASRAYLVGYGGPAQVGMVIAQVWAALDAVDVAVPIAVRATGRRYFCIDPDCDTCPAGGTAYDPDTSLIAVQSVVAGLAVLPDRAALAASLHPVEGQRRTDMDAACDRASQRMRAMLGAPANTAERAVNSAGRTAAERAVATAETVPAWVVEAGLDALADALATAEAGQVLSDDEVGWLAVVLRIGVVQAAAWSVNTGDTWQRQLWTDVVRRATPALTAVPACLLASTAYLAGNGALANIAVQQALQVDPGTTFARPMDFALSRGLPPQAWQQVLHSVIQG
ncbi:hypothetical protein GCM10027610_025450 [Dactylosporangium cerinum]